MHIDTELMDANFTLMNGLSTGDRIRVVADHETYEGTFKGVLVNRDGLVLTFTHRRTKADGHEVECETALPGPMVKRLERIGGPAPAPNE